MTTRRVQEGSLRPGRLEFSSIGLALLISLVIHGGGYGVYKVGQSLHLWQQLRLPEWVARTKMLSAPPKEQKAANETPLIFVDVNPQAATVEPPKDAKYYAANNSQAANTEADQDTGVPKISGKQTDIVKAEDVPRAVLDRLQPLIPPAEPEQQPAERPKPQTAAPPGDLALGRPEANPREGDGTSERSRPRTLREVKARENRNQLVGSAMRQDGGVSRMRIVSLDAKATALGEYDARFFEVIQQCWFDLLEQYAYTSERSGRVVVRFRLHFNGRISDLVMLENTTGRDIWGVVCQQALLQPAPYEPWPRSMRLEVDKDYREIRLGFLYY